MKPAYFLIAAIAAAFGWFGALHLRNLSDSHAKDEAAEGRKILLYQSPMHP